MGKSDRNIFQDISKHKKIQAGFKVVYMNNFSRS
jgi:hypothetical protein